MKVNTNNLPKRLQQDGRFCVWKYEERDGRKTKPPYNPNAPQYGAKSNDPATFATMEQAVAIAESGNFDGVGVGIFDDLAGIDIDHCMTESGGLSPMAQDIVKTMNCYTEVSPSGEGLRILFLAPGFNYDKDKYYIKSKQGLEVYIAGMTNRYLTVTGNVLNSTDLEDRTEQLQIVLDRYMKRPSAEDWQYIRTEPERKAPADLTDDELIERAMNAGNGGTFSSLWNGYISDYPSHSEADQALCNLLAFWTNKDAARMDNLFRQSGLMRQKWDRRQSGSTYGAITIRKAIAGCAEGYNPQGGAERLQAVVSTQPEQNTPAPAEVPQEAAQRPRTAAEMFDSFLDKVQTDIYKPLPTGMPAFDNLLGGGVLRQSLVILSAAPGTGKTTLAQQVFETMATTGADVVFLNLEMSREQLLARSLSRMIHRNGHSMTAAEVLKGYAWTDTQKNFVMEAAEEYRSKIAPHFVYNPSGAGITYQSIGALLNKYGDAMRQQGKRAPVVVLDYLHLVQSEKREDAQEIIKCTVAMLKNYAVRYDTFVFALSATNRTSNASGTISLESSRDSSGIEYTADYLLALNYKALALNESKPDSDQKYRANNPNDMEALQMQDPRKMLVQVLKNRMNAAGGKLPLAFDAKHSIFYPTEKQAYYSTDFYNGDEIETI